MDYNNLNLRERSFLDFTDDKEVIADIITRVRDKNLQFTTNPKDI